jgi:pimeloyl-ACP methyl ester carboxylesterase
MKNTAAFGAFLTTQENAAKALDLAYRDVAAAFDAFVAQAGDRPIILAGHSQGSLHLIRLLREKIAGKPIEKRIVAAYVVGWPVSRTSDLPALGLPECRTADQAGCILSWQSFAEPADPSLILDTYNASSSVDGVSRRGTAMICTNPLTGMPDAIAPATSNLGTLFPSADLSSATIEPGRVAARCDSRGILLIGNPPSLGGYVLPGNNYHVYDYSLFWANVRADAARRLATFTAASVPAGQRRRAV